MPMDSFKTGVEVGAGASVSVGAGVDVITKFSLMSSSAYGGLYPAALFLPEDETTQRPGECRL